MNVSQFAYLSGYMDKTASSDLMDDVVTDLYGPPRTGKATAANTGASTGTSPKKPKDIISEVDAPGPGRPGPPPPLPNRPYKAPAPAASPRKPMNIQFSTPWPTAPSFTPARPTSKPSRPPMQLPPDLQPGPPKTAPEVKLPRMPARTQATKIPKTVSPEQQNDAHVSAYALDMQRKARAGNSQANTSKKR